MKIEVFGKTLTFTCKTQVKVTLLMKTWNDPTVITVILPQPVSHKPIIEVRFLTKVLKSIFPKVWDSFPGQYLTIWRSFCGNFDDSSIRTRLEWSPGSQKYRFPQKCEFMLYSSNSGARGQRRQPLSIGATAFRNPSLQGATGDHRMPDTQAVESVNPLQIHEN